MTDSPQSDFVNSRQRFHFMYASLSHTPVYKKNLRNRKLIKSQSPKHKIYSQHSHFYSNNNSNSKISLSKPLMATCCKTHQLAAVVFFLFVFTSSSLSSARLLNDFLSHGLAATEPTLSLALPVDDDNNNDVFNKIEQDTKPQVLPCDHMVLIKNSDVGILRSPTPRLTGKYGPMILSMLPKGSPVPPSAPGNGINDVKN